MAQKKKTKACTICGKPSIPGLLPLSGKCQYHWDVGAYGKAWADRCASQKKQIK